jgi:hypothetical protein
LEWWADPKIYPEPGGFIETMSKIESARHKLTAAIQALNAELDRLTEAPVPQYTTEAQLLRFKQVLELMLHEVETGNLRPQGQRSSGMGRVIVDAWPYHSPLALLTLEAEQAYIGL